MTPRLFALTVAAVMAVGGSAVAAGYSSTTPSKATTTSSKATAAAADKLTTKEMNSAIALDKVSNPQSALVMAKVDDHSGHNVGEVKSVVTGTSGSPTAIQVDVGNNHVVSMDAKNLTYIPDRKILLTRMSKSQAEKLPAVKG